jgi:hypothetical protein
MTINLDALATRVRHEVETYEIPPPHPGQLGKVLPDSWFKDGLDHMRNALVEPYWIDADDHEAPNGPQAKRVVVVANDKAGHLVALDPAPPSRDDGDFVVLWAQEGKPSISHLRGDAVGCFLSI